MAICYDNIKIYGCQLDQTSPTITFGIGGPIAFYRQLFFDNEKTQESSIYLTYAGPSSQYIAYRITGRTSTGMAVTEVVIVNASAVQSARSDYRYLDKVEKVCLDNSYSGVLSDAIFLDTNGDGHIDTRVSEQCEELSDIVYVREGSASGTILCKMLNADNNMVPADGGDPTDVLSGEEVLAFQRPFFDVNQIETGYYYQKVFIANLLGVAINEGQVVLTDPNVAVSFEVGADSVNNGSDSIDNFFEPTEPPDVAFDGLTAIIPGSQGDPIGTMDLNSNVGIWVRANVTSVAPVDFGINFTLRGTTLSDGVN
jgi:hypothetical protein